MDRYEKSAEFLMRRGNEIIAERKRRKSFILRSCAIGAGVAAVLGVGLTTYALRPPKKPTLSQSGIIVETETTSAETTVAPTIEGTTSPQTVTTEQETTVTTTALSSTALSATTTFRTTTITTRTTLSDTFVQAPITTEIQTNVVSPVTTTYHTSIILQSTTATSASVETVTTPAVTSAIEISKKVYYDVNKKTYQQCCLGDEGIVVDEANVGEFYDDAVLSVDITDNSNKKTKSIQTTCRLYAYGDLPTDYICIIKESEDSVPILYSSGVPYEAFESSFSILVPDLENQ